MRISTSTKVLGALALLLATVFCLFLFAARTTAEVSFKVPAPETNGYRFFNFFTATTTNATSTNTSDGGGYFVINNAKNVVMYFSRGGATSANTGTSTFNVQVSPNGSNWYDYRDLRAIGSEINASAAYDTRTGSSSIEAATSTKMYTLDAKGFYAIRCIVVETIDGEHTCKAAAEF